MSDPATTADPYSGLGPPRPAARSTPAARRFVAIPGIVLAVLIALDATLRFVPEERLPAALTPHMSVVPLPPIAEPEEEARHGDHEAPVRTLDFVLPRGDLAITSGVPRRLWRPRRVVISTDRQGLRNPSTCAHEAEVVTVGDSFMFGNGPDDETPAALLARATGLAVHSRARPSTSMYTMVREYLVSPALAAHAPRAVVWGIADRQIMTERDPSRRAGSKESRASKLRKAVKRSIESALSRLVLLAPARLIAQSLFFDAADLLAPDRLPSGDVVVARLRSGEERLLLGREVACVTSPDEARVAGAAPSVIEVCRLLEAKGVTVVPVLIPSSSDVYGDQVVATNPAGRAPRPAARAQIDLLEERLAAAGIRCVNARAPLRAEAARRSAEGLPPLYFPDDTHWNEVGIELAMRLVAEELRRRGIGGAK